MKIPGVLHLVAFHKGRTARTSTGSMAVQPEPVGPIAWIRVVDPLDIPFTLDTRYLSVIYTFKKTEEDPGATQAR